MRKIYKYDACHNTYDACHRSRGKTLILEKTSSPFSPQKERCGNDSSPMTCATLKKELESQKLAGDSTWLSRKMIGDGCSLKHTLQVMEERCKNCSVITPITCMEQCETWKLKRELHETTQTLSRPNHGLRLLNALKNRRRLTILNILRKHPLSTKDLQRKLQDLKHFHSQETIQQYLKPLVKASLVRMTDERFGLTLYGQKVVEAMKLHSFEGQLPVNSGCKEERILRSLLEGVKTRDELLHSIPTSSLSRILKRLLKLNLIHSDSPSDRIFYFRTKRPAYMDHISPTQRKICATIPQAGISARALSKLVGINLRRTYKYLRNLRGKKLVFRREVPHEFHLTEKGRKIAEFLEEIAEIE